MGASNHCFAWKMKRGQKIYILFRHGGNPRLGMLGKGSVGKGAANTT